MTASTGRVFGPKPFGAAEPIPVSLLYPLAANVAPSRNWLMGLDLSTGYAKAMAAGTANLVSAGYSDRDDAASATAGAAFFLGRQQFVSGFPNSTAGSDAILSTDIAVPCWAADNQTVGKLSNQGGNNRSLLGVAFGIDPDNSTPIIYPGPVGWLLGRSAHIADNIGAGSYTKAVDAGATSDLAEDLVPRAKLHGTIKAVEFVVSGTTLSASGSTNFKTITISKRDGAGGSPVVVATADTKTTNWTQWTAVSFTLSAVAGALDLLETDILTIQESHGASGAVIPAGSLRVVMKVG